MTNRRWTRTPGRLVGAVLATALALALAGCADTEPTQDVRSGPTSPSTSTPTVVTTVPSLPTSSAPPASEPGSVDPSPPVTGSDPAPATTVPTARGPAHRWEGYTVGADGVTLTFTYYAGVEPCSVFDSIVADEGPDTVRVSIYERAGDGQTMCIMIAQLKSATVVLASPLGSRTVVDGAA